MLDETAASIRKATGVTVIAVATDVSDPAAIDQLWSTARSEFGRVDILVTNAGGPSAGPFESHPPSAWSDALRLNFESVVNLTRAVLPGMKERGWGRIINITSIAVKQPVDNLILSNSVRAAVTGFAVQCEAAWNFRRSDHWCMGITDTDGAPRHTSGIRSDGSFSRIGASKLHDRRFDSRRRWLDSHATLMRSTQLLHRPVPPATR